MAVQTWTTGAVPIICGVGSSGAPMLLGWAEKFPRIQIRPYWQRVFCDLGGQSCPFDYMFDGQEGLVTADVIRFDEATYRVIADRANTNDPGVAAREPGLNEPGEIGTLMVQEKVAYQLWLPFLYANKPTMPGMRRGYRFRRAFLEGPDDLEQGTVPRKVRMVWRCVHDFDDTSRNDYGVGNMPLYDDDMSAVDGLQLR